MAQIQLFTSGTSYIAQAGTQGPYIPIRYFRVSYDPRLDSEVVISPLNISATDPANTVIETSPLIYNNTSASYTLSTNEVIPWNSGTTITTTGTSGSNYNSTTQMTLLGNAFVNQVISGTNIVYNSPNWSYSNGGLATSAAKPSNATNRTSYFSLDTYAPVTSGGTISRGYFKVRLDQSVDGTIKFNKVYLYAAKFDNNGVEVFAENPVLFGVVNTGKTIVKSNTGNYINNYELDVQIEFTSSGYASQIYFVGDNNGWHRTPIGNALWWNGNVALGTSAIPNSWNANAQLDITSDNTLYPYQPYLKLTASERNTFTEESILKYIYKSQNYDYIGNLVNYIEEQENTSLPIFQKIYTSNKDRTRSSISFRVQCNELTSDIAYRNGDTYSPMFRQIQFYAIGDDGSYGQSSIDAILISGPGNYIDTYDSLNLSVGGRQYLTLNGEQELLVLGISDKTVLASTSFEESLTFTPVINDVTYYSVYVPGNAYIKGEMFFETYPLFNGINFYNGAFAQPSISASGYSNHDLHFNADCYIQRDFVANSNAYFNSFIYAKRFLNIKEVNSFIRSATLSADYIGNLHLSNYDYTEPFETIIHGSLKFMDSDVGLSYDTSSIIKCGDATSDGYLFNLGFGVQEHLNIGKTYFSDNMYLEYNKNFYIGFDVRLKGNGNYNSSTASTLVIENSSENSSYKSGGVNLKLLSTSTKYTQIGVDIDNDNVTNFTSNTSKYKFDKGLEASNLVSNGSLILYGKSYLTGITEAVGSSDITVSSTHTSSLTPTYKIVNWSVVGKTAFISIRIEADISHTATSIFTIKISWPKTAITIAIQDIITPSVWKRLDGNDSTNTYAGTTYIDSNTTSNYIELAFHKSDNFSSITNKRQSFCAIISAKIL